MCPKLYSAKYLATINTKIIFAYSEGCKLTGPIMIQRRAPKMSVPANIVINIKIASATAKTHTAFDFQNEKFMRRQMKIAIKIPTAPSPACFNKKSNGD